MFTMMKLTRVMSATACAALGVFAAVACSGVEDGERGAGLALARR